MKQSSLPAGVLNLIVRAQRRAITAQQHRIRQLNLDLLRARAIGGDRVVDRRKAWRDRLQDH